MGLKIFDTLSRGKKGFRPLEKGKAKMYVCGPTVYGPDHLGHGRVGVFYDVLRRYLEYSGLKVEMVQNITDVGHLTDDADSGEDKVEKKAKKEGKTPQEITDYYIKRHFEDMDSLNVVRPTYSPVASQYIPAMIEFVKKLIENGFGYESGGNVYFDISKFKDYGKLSGKNLDQLRESVRVESDNNKKHPLDFALWLKADKNHLQKWDSPWSEGYPGWHLECSVMNLELLGPTLDIHGGAIELAFPHHENEIAQSESLTGEQFVRYWVHIGMVQINGVKMGKSKGNFLTIRKLLKQYTPDQIRLALLMTQYRKPFDYTQRRMEEAGKIINKLTEAKAKLKVGESKEGREQFEKIMDDNINTPELITFLMNKLDSIDKKLFEDITGILGLKLKQVEIPVEIKQMAQIRQELRAQKKFIAADQVRKKISKKGYQIRDIGKDKYEIWRA